MSILFTLNVLQRFIMNHLVFRYHASQSTHSARIKQTLILLFAIVITLQAVEFPSWADDRFLLRNTDHAEYTHPSMFTKFRPREEKEKSPLIAKATARKSGMPSLEEKKHFPSKPIPLNELDGNLVQRVFFDYKKSVLKTKAKKEIQINCHWLKKHQEYDILIEGHCDERGSNEYNLALGERRAAAVRDFMIDLGISSNRVAMKSWGEEKPLDSRATEEAYALNRRVEFYAIPLKEDESPSD